MNNGLGAVGSSDEEQTLYWKVFEKTRDKTLDLLGDGLVYLVAAVACHIFRIHYAYPLLGIGVGMGATELFLKGIRRERLHSIAANVVKFQAHEKKYSKVLRTFLLALPLFLSRSSRPWACCFGLLFGVVHKLACDRQARHHNKATRAREESERHSKGL